MTDSTPRAVLRGFLPVSLAFLAYVVTLVVSLRLLARGIDDRNAEIAVSLAPILPTIAVCLCIVRQIRRLDEMQRALQFEALALSFAATALLTFSYGFLENVGFPKLSAFAVLPLMCGLWVLGVLAGQWRYR
uniref:hypothetical protein n=1 Tax=Stappia sp. TaxID=1870903 RepID=UPI003BA93138